MITKERFTEILTNFREVLEKADKHYESMVQIMEMKRMMLEMAKAQLSEEDYQNLVDENAEMSAKETYAGKRMNVMKLTHAYLEERYAEMEDAA